MTESQTHTFDNLGPEEWDHYKGKRIFERYELISYPFVQHVDGMASDGKKQYADQHPFILIHDFNNYGHGKGSAHYGDPDGGECVAVDFRWRGLSLYEGLMLAFKYRFNGIFVYPFARMPFIHVDQKTWNRPEGVTTFGYRDQKGDMVTCNNNFDEVIRLFAMLPELMNDVGNPLNGAD